MANVYVYVFLFAMVHKKFKNIYKKVGREIENISMVRTIKFENDSSIIWYKEVYRILLNS